MRITQGMLSNQMLFDLQGNLDRVAQLQSEGDSGKRINSPSDDPVGAEFVMRYKAQLSYYQQYQDNASTANGWLSYTGTVMSEANSVVQRARDLAVQGSSDTMSSTDRADLAAEVDQLQQQLVAIGNSQYDGKYVFNGLNTAVAPYSSGAPETAVTNDGAIQYDVGDGTYLKVNVSGNSYLGSGSDGDNVFKALEELKSGLTANDTNTISDALGKIDSRSQKMLSAQADIGARQNRVQMMQTRLNDMKNNVTTLLADTNDADLAQVITDLQTAETVRNAALDIGSKVIQPTLADFLK